jgi:spore germination protein GerM
MAEQAEGFFTSINQGVKLQSLNIREDGTAFVDFDEQLQAGVGGSCKVSAIRAQITETLKQFPTVKNVIISINGRTEDILQP